MASLEQRDFYLNRVQGRIRILNKAIADKNIDFDITKLTEAIENDLKAGEEITIWLLSRQERHDLEEIRDKFLEVQLQFEVSLHRFNELKSQNCTIKFSKWWTWVMGYVVLSTKQSRWQLLSLTVTLLASIISLWSAYRLGKEARDYYYPFGYHWLRHLLRPPQTVGIASIVSLCICLIAGMMNVFCVCKPVRKHWQNGLFWSHLISAFILGVNWILILVVCVTCAREGQAFSTRVWARIIIGAALVVLTTQMTMIALSLVQLINRRSERIRLQRGAGDGTTVTWNYGHIPNTSTYETEFIESNADYNS
ncbi:uncharacterized protein LOC142338110 [Convolutriloba macropyga]|uniref:uncharacterized protein LOC142338110 n=1 Tax=Convolutriloba macropyga TaxID=536237 RepID=UPI003F527210